MAARNAVLSQSSEFKEARVRALTNAIAVYDLLTVILVCWKQFTLLQEVRVISFFYINRLTIIVYSKKLQ